MEFDNEEDAINSALLLVGKKLGDHAVRARTADRARSGYAMALPSKEISAAARAHQQQQQTHLDVPLEWRVPAGQPSFPTFGYAPFEAAAGGADSRPSRKKSTGRRRRDERGGGRAGHFENGPAPLPLPVSPTLTGAPGAPTVAIGYTTSYIHYTREEIANILDDMHAAKSGGPVMYRPASLPAAADCVAIRVTPSVLHTLRDPQPIIFPASPSPALAAQPAIGASMPFLDLNMSTGLSGLDLDANGSAATGSSAAASASARPSAPAASTDSAGGVFAKPAPPQRPRQEGKAAKAKGPAATGSWAAKAQAPAAPAKAPASAPAAASPATPAKKSWKPKQPANPAAGAPGTPAPASGSSQAQPPAPAAAAPVPAPAAASSSSSAPATATATAAAPTGTWAAKLAAAKP